jgi:hypothetical protein
LKSKKPTKMGKNSAKKYCQGRKFWLGLSGGTCEKIWTEKEKEKEKRLEESFLVFENQKQEGKT